MYNKPTEENAPMNNSYPFYILNIFKELAVLVVMKVIILINEKKRIQEAKK